MSGVWLTAEEVMELGVPDRTLRDWARRGKLTTRPGPKGANGQARREIDLSSLPAEIQARYFQMANGEGRTANEMPNGEGRMADGENVRNPQFDIGNSPEGASGCSAAPEGESDLGASRASAEANLPPASLSQSEEEVQKFKSSTVQGSAENPLAGLSEEKISELTALAEVVRQAQGKTKKEREWIAKKNHMSLSKLERKIRAFAERGIAGLARKRRADRGRARVADDKIVARIQALYLKPYRPPVTHIYKEVAKDYQLSGLTPPSCSFVRRMIGNIPPDLVARYRMGERTFDDRFAYASLRRKPALPRQWVDMDHHPCDHMVVFPDGSIGRPWLTAAQDISTNEILGFYLTREKPVGKGTYPGSTAIGLTLRHAILKKDDPLWPSFGLFENLYADLGKDFRSGHVRAVCQDLGIKIVYTRGYHGKSKPIERWFGVMETALRGLPGYTGSNPETNPERQKLRPEPLDPKTLLSIYGYESALRDWIVREFHHRESRALAGRSPMETLEARVKDGWSPREVRDERVLDLLLMRRKGAPSKVHNYGVTLFGRPYMALELLALIGQEVEPFWDDSRLGEILVYQKNRFICQATNKEMLEFGASKETLERERELKRTQKRHLAERMDEIQAQAQYPNPLARAAAEERLESVLDEERKQIAVNATAGRATTALLPKYQRAVKLLSEKELGKMAKRVLTEVKKSPIENRKSEIENQEENPWLEEEKVDLKGMFKRERNEWLEDEDGK